MKCPECGHELPVSAKFCPHCGKPVEANLQSREKETRNELEYVEYALIGSGVAAGLLLFISVGVYSPLGMFISLLIGAVIYQSYQYVKKQNFENAFKYTIGAGITLGVLGGLNLAFQATGIAMIELLACGALLYAAKGLKEKLQNDK